MKVSVKLLIAFSFIISFSHCIQPKQENHNLTVQINNVSRLKKDTLKEIGNIYYSIDFDLINHTDSTIHFWMMTCSKINNFIFNVKNVYVITPYPCDSNFPAVRTIERNQNMNFKGLIGTTDTANLKLDLKLGFIYIRKEEKSHLYELIPPPPIDSCRRKHETHKNIIWSETFRLEK